MFGHAPINMTAAAGVTPEKANAGAENYLATPVASSAVRLLYYSISTPFARSPWSSRFLLYQTPPARPPPPTISHPPQTHSCLAASQYQQSFLAFLIFPGFRSDYFSPIPLSLVFHPPRALSHALPPSSIPILLPFAETRWSVHLCKLSLSHTPANVATSRPRFFYCCRHRRAHRRL